MKRRWRWPVFTILVAWLADSLMLQLGQRLHFETFTWSWKSVAFWAVLGIVTLLIYFALDRLRGWLVAPRWPS